jgi:putative FmdB family regulatory protein
MPTYEYLCEKCNRVFAVKMSMADHDKGGVTCPTCNESRVLPQYTAFFAKTSKKS